ncbi:hypothetical protein QCE47_08000 [Caballeronia sp. LZ025]|jgi:hypothetical protein|uniref:hypothetical protein n=1 Tax=Caballeronia TaxID=1827195 RepID=UPI001FD3E874|nr:MULTISPECIES: hypothetical protein [Caballeronia]MDR5732286.1 hypothetical protein [Caballeronia sp. LZ025]
MDTLKQLVYFHDWHIDALSVREGNRLVLSLSFDKRQAEVEFVGTSRCSVQHFGILNIVYDIMIISPSDASYSKALTALAQSDRFSKVSGRLIAFIAATAGAELFVEFDSLEIREISAKQGEKT